MNRLRKADEKVRFVSNLFFAAALFGYFVFVAALPLTAPEMMIEIDTFIIFPFGCS